MLHITHRLRLDSRALALFPLLALGACAQPKATSGQLYVSNERSDEVVTIDPATGAIGAHIAVGQRPRGILFSPDGATLYVAVSGSPIGGPGVDDDSLPLADHKADGVAVIDVASGKVGRVLPVGDDPETFALSADGRTLYVSNESAGAVSAVAVDGGRVPISTKVGEEPEGIAISGDGKNLFVACEASDHVAMLDARTMRVIRTIKIEGRPRGLLISRDGGTIYASVESGGKLAILSAADGTLRKLLDLAKGDKTIKPMGMVEASDGHLFVTTGRYGAVIEVDPKAGTIVRTIPHVGARPWGIALTADGKTLVTANGSSDDVSLIDRASGKIVRKLNVGKGPWGIAAKGEASGS